VKGIEPSYEAWKATALPLSYTRVFQWGVQDSNLRRQSHQIYSLTRLTASVTPRATSNSLPSHNAEDRLATAIADGDRNQQAPTYRSSRPRLTISQLQSLDYSYGHTGDSACHWPRLLTVTRSKIDHKLGRSQTRREFPNSTFSLDELAEGLEPTTC
jgi:hypothetical protein